MTMTKTKGLSKFPTNTKYKILPETRKLIQLVRTFPIMSNEERKFLVF